MVAGRGHLAVLALAPILAACATPSGLAFEDQRTVFNNPFVPPVIDPGTVGPRCDERRVRGSVCTAGPIVWPGRGRHALLPNGEVVRLTRAERRFLRERAEALQAQIDIRRSLAKGTPLPPGSPALPPDRRAPKGRERAPERAPSPERAPAPEPVPQREAP